MAKKKETVKKMKTLIDNNKDKCLIVDSFERTYICNYKDLENTIKEIDTPIINLTVYEVGAGKLKKLKLKYS